MKLLQSLLVLPALTACLLGMVPPDALAAGSPKSASGTAQGVPGAAVSETAGAAETARQPEYDGFLVEIDVPMRLLSASDPAFPVMNAVYAPGRVYQAEDTETLEALRAWGVLRHVEPNYIVTLDDTPSLSGEFDGTDTLPAYDGTGAALPEYGGTATLPVTDSEGADGEKRALLLDASEEPWYMSALEMDWVRAQGITGKSVRVGIVDSGLYKEHEEFQGVKVLSGANYCVSETSPDRADVSDNVGHGTFVSALIAAAENQAGIVGLAPDVELVPLKCFESKNGSIANIAAAIYDAVDTWHCQVLNLSLGIESDSAVLRKAIEYADKAGVIMVAAAGNLLSGNHRTSGDPLNYPAAYPEVIGVGAVGSDLSVSSFSYRNASVAVCAPGQNLRGPSYTSPTRYVSGYGTSYAAPMVTAAAVLALSARPALSAAEFREMLSHTVRDAGPAGYDTAYGYGVLHMGHLLSAVTGNLSHQVTLYRREFADTDGPTPSLFAAAYTREGALAGIVDVSPPVALDREPDTTPILAAGLTEYPEEAFRIEGAERWKLFPLDRFTSRPLQAAVALYGPVAESESQIIISS